MISHTSAPWRKIGWDIVGSDNSIIAKVLPWDSSGCRREDHANINACVNAPDLLISCRELLGILSEHEQNASYTPTLAHNEIISRAIITMEAASSNKI